MADSNPPELVTVIEGRASDFSSSETLDGPNAEETPQKAQASFSHDANQEGGGAIFKGISGSLDTDLHPSPLPDDTVETPRSEALSTTESSSPALNPQRKPSVDLTGNYFVPRSLYAGSLPASPSPRSSIGSLRSSKASSTAISSLRMQSYEAAKTTQPIASQKGPTAGHDSPVIAPTVSDSNAGVLPTPTSATSADSPTSLPAIPAAEKPKPRDYPVYPNQAYSVLQSQHYPTHTSRARTSHSAHYSSHSTNSASRRRSRDLSSTDQGSKTAGHTPASSPGLFAPVGSTGSLPPAGDGSPQGTPLLHWTQRQLPKETHIADVDIDPISGRKLLNQYEIIAELGRGVHGKVKLGRNLDKNEDVAIKIVNRYSKRRRLGKLGDPEDKVKKEVAILKKAIHDHVVALLELIDDPAKKKVYIVLEYVEHGEIIWRTKGQPDVLGIERRRIERENERPGRNMNSAEELQILRDEIRWKDRRERRHALGQDPSGIGQTWSLEYGTVSDEEADPEVDQSSQGDGESQAGTDPSVLVAEGVDEADYAAYESLPLPLDQRETTSNPVASPTSAPGSHPSTASLSQSAYDNLRNLPLGECDPSIAGSFYSQSSADIIYDPYAEDFSYVPCLTIEQARQTIRDTVLGLEYLHFQGIIHRDIKPSNLLWTSDFRVKISDFGVSYLGRPIRDDDNTEDISEADAQPLDEAVELAKTVGTPAFYAPELCYTDLAAPRPPVTGQIDIWALGVTLYCLIYARLPFLALDEFSLFKSIAEDEVSIPRRRLKAVFPRTEHNTPSDPKPADDDHRLEDEVVYEQIDDDLHDLLKRILEKNPTKRITLREIKRHPFVLHGISDPVRWIDDTDPSRQNDGRKIEVSTEDVEKAVVPIGLLERVRSGMRRMGAAIGFGKAREGRRRARSSAWSADGSSSNKSASPTPTIREGRSLSLRDESISSGPRAIHEGEHPLAQSLTVTPEPRDSDPFVRESITRNAASATNSPTKVTSPGAQVDGLRPSALERTFSNSAESTKTVRPAYSFEDLSHTSPATSPGLPDRPIVLDSGTNQNLGAIFGGVSGRQLTVRTKPLDDTDTGHITRSDAPQHERGVPVNSDDPHGDPSVAISTTSAFGEVETVSIPMEYHFPRENALAIATPVPNSPTPKTPESPKRGDLSVLDEARRLSITAAAVGRPPTAPADTRRGSMFGEIRSPQEFRHESTAESFSRAQDELIRRRNLEFVQSQDRPRSMMMGKTDPWTDSSCPPSPDDDIFYRHRKSNIARSEDSGMRPLADPQTKLPVFPPLQPPLMYSSSEDHLTSGMSQSESHPSIPSVISPSSSILTNDPLVPFFKGDVAGPSSLAADTVTPPSRQHSPKISAVASEEDVGYNGDHAGDSGDDSPDSDEDFLVMTRRKSLLQGVPDEVTPKAETEDRQSRPPIKETTSTTTIPLARSGSSGTLKKALSSEESERNPSIDAPAPSI
ncbi:MAG: hypothetical protein M1825_003386 [Sarcosagium campestre]|nr:MAG: hypothetical protein M1825_003386 [Sarcosagium campestre]